MWNGELSTHAAGRFCVCFLLNSVAGNEYLHSVHTGVIDLWEPPDRDWPEWLDDEGDWEIVIRAE